MYVPVITSHEYILMSLSGGGGDSPSEVPCAPILAIEDSCVGDLTEVVLRAGVKVCEGEGRKKLGGSGGVIFGACYGKSLGVGRSA